MSVAAAVPAAPVAGEWTWPAGRRIGNFAIGAIVFLGGFVIAEPAPYELLLCPVIVVWAFFGLTIHRAFAPMVVLLLLYLAGGILTLTQTADLPTGLLYMATSAFVIFSAFFFAAVIAAAPEERLPIIMRAYVAGAVITTLLGIAGYFHAFPGADVFLRYDRVKGAFQDPNVFGPFLVLPAAYLFRGILTRPLRRSLGSIVLLLILLAGLFLAFSRAAWGMATLALVLTAGFTFLTERRPVARLRLLLYLGLALLIVGLLIAGALSIPAISNLFAQRAHFVEDYDSGDLGRFGRQQLGFFLVQQRPLGIGPLQFAHMFGEDEHNMWLKGFTTYGWLGGFAYIALVLWTIFAAGRLLLKPRPWQPYLQCAFAVYLGQVMIHNVIDNDHWRHLFLLYGMLWGIVAAERLYVRAARRNAARQRPPVSTAVPAPAQLTA